ncbi:MAG: hypothetical protein EOO60_05900 [Hymenobacter sp.]|nr:MAG: hypothetical protein EOO60_05900 [Hymenobacter sp.]
MRTIDPVLQGARPASGGDLLSAAATAYLIKESSARLVSDEGQGKSLRRAFQVPKGRGRIGPSPQRSRTRNFPSSLPPPSSSYWTTLPTSRYDSPSPTGNAGALTKRRRETWNARLAVDLCVSPDALAPAFVP